MLLRLRSTFIQARYVYKVKMATQQQQAAPAPSSSLSTSTMMIGGGGGGIGGSSSSNNNNNTLLAESALSELNETVSRLSSHKGVETVQILNRNGDIITESTSRTTIATSATSAAAASTTSTVATIETSSVATAPGAATATVTGASSTSSSLEGESGIGIDPTTLYLTKQAALTKKLMEIAGMYLQNSDMDDEVSFIQIRSKNGQELMIAPNEGYVLAVHKR
jgi:predicted regulator of Ras-like GTPase activity (Roadblock/LC7/MglB family)